MKCDLVYTRYTAYNGTRPFCVNHHFRQHVESEGYHRLWHDAHRVLRDSLISRHGVSLANIEVQQLGMMYVRKVSQKKCVESRERAMKIERKRNGPQQIDLPFKQKQNSK